MKALVHIIDDDPAIRDAMKALLESVDIEAATYDRAQAFLDAPESARPGCLVLDLRIPDMSGLEVQQRCIAHGRPQPIIFLTGYGDIDVSVRAMHQGAAEFLTKPVCNETLLQRVREAIELDQQRRLARNRQASVQARIDLLSPREREVLDGVLDGHSNKEIARTMSISHKTVELHRGKLMHKMHAQSVAELVRMCVELQMVTDDKALAQEI